MIAAFQGENIDWGERPAAGTGARPRRGGGRRGQTSDSVGRRRPPGKGAAVARRSPAIGASGCADRRAHAAGDPGRISTVRRAGGRGRTIDKLVSSLSNL